jgi:FecR protein
MRSFFQLAAVLLTLALLCLATDQNPQPQPTSLPIGSAAVADFKGDVSLRSPTGEVLTPRRGLILEAESIIEIGKGSLLLNMRDGSEVLIKSQSRVVLKSPAAEGGFYLRFLLGKLVAKIQKRLGEEPSFRIGTPSAVITVRGTRFQVEVNRKNHTYVEVFEGIVAVQGLVPNSPPVFLRPGFSTQVEPDRRPEPPRRTNDMSDFFNRSGEGQGEDNGGSRQPIPSSGPQGQGQGEGEGQERPDH